MEQILSPTCHFPKQKSQQFVFRFPVSPLSGNYICMLQPPPPPPVS